VMGGVPLIWLVPMLWRALTRPPDPDDGPSAGYVPAYRGGTSVGFNPPPSSTTPTTTWSTPTGVWFNTPSASGTGAPTISAPAPAAPSATATASSTGKDLAGELERLASLHRRRELTDAEYEAAKSKAIANTERPT
jgi:hypothetical protein